MPDSDREATKIQSKPLKPNTERRLTMGTRQSRDSKSVQDAIHLGGAEQCNNVKINACTAAEARTQEAEWEAANRKTWPNTKRKPKPHKQQRSLGWTDASKSLVARIC